MTDIRPTMTQARRHYLARLASREITGRASNNVGYQCMQLGWTEWLFSDGVETLTETDFRAKFAPGEERSRAYGRWNNVSEVVTAAGLKALEGL